MDAFKTLSALFLVLSIPATSAIAFDASVEPNTTFSAKNLQYRENITGLQKANVTVFNTGSVGCTYQLRAVFNNSEQAYSQQKALWPGSSALLEVNEHFTGNGSYRSGLILEYCGQTKEVGNFSFTAEEASATEEDINSTTVSSSKEKVKFTLEAEEGLLIPEETPPYWEVPSTNFVNSTATVGLEAPIYDSEEEIKFQIYNSSKGEITGTTTVGLEQPEPGIWQKRLQMLKENSPPLLAISLLLNMILAGIILQKRREQ